MERRSGGTCILSSRIAPAIRASSGLGRSPDRPYQLAIKRRNFGREPPRSLTRIDDCDDARHGQVAAGNHRVGIELHEHAVRCPCPRDAIGRMWRTCRLPKGTATAALRVHAARLSCRARSTSAFSHMAFWRVQYCTHRRVLISGFAASTVHADLSMVLGGAIGQPEHNL